MRKIIFAVPVSRAPMRAPLTCAWTTTGDPRQPLTRRWGVKAHASLDDSSLPAESEPSQLLCA